MTIYLTYSGIKVQCGHCHADHDWQGFHILWANQHGAAVRLFCRKCGHITDVKHVGKKYTATITPKPYKWGTPKSNPVGWRVRK